MDRKTVLIVGSMIAVCAVAIWISRPQTAADIPPPLDPLATLLNERFQESVGPASQNFAAQVRPVVQDAITDLPSARSTFRKTAELAVLDFDSYLSRFATDAQVRQNEFAQHIQKAYDDTFGRILERPLNVFVEEEQNLKSAFLLDSSCSIGLASGFSLRNPASAVLSDIDQTKNLAINIACDAGSWIPLYGLAFDGAELTGVRSDLMYGNSLDRLSAIAEQQAREILKEIDLKSSSSQVETFCRKNFDLKKALASFEE
jgi:hypothetical protein